jgi:hypothetical protein
LFQGDSSGQEQRWRLVFWPHRTQGLRFSLLSLRFLMQVAQSHTSVFGRGASQIMQSGGKIKSRAAMKIRRAGLFFRG